jgi:acetylornithine deacetylase/succinyl-diaminopimelate desuccinylase-like protein
MRVYCSTPLPGRIFVRFPTRIPAALGALTAVVALGFGPGGLRAQTSPNEREARAIFAELIGVNTTHDRGTTRAVRLLARRFLAAGFPAKDVVIAGGHPLRQNLVVRLRGSGARKPILLLAHLDVVEARREDWSLEPFALTEQDGYFYGRGTADIKDMAAIFSQTLLRLQRERVKLDRDVILALTADEEGGDDNGVQWLLANRRDLIDAAFGINADAGDPVMRDGRVYERNVEASEKVYMDVRLEVRNPGGHSSIPVKENAIYRLAAALERFGQYEFPPRLNEVTRAYFTRAAASETDTIAARMRMVGEAGDTTAMRRLSEGSPWLSSVLRTTCVATRLDGGHANNALPETAGANINCRLLPDERPDHVIETIRRVVADTNVLLTVTSPPVPSPPSPLDPEVLEPIDSITAAMWPGAAVVPSMDAGSSDCLFLRNAGMPVYGVSGVPLDYDDIRWHGKDERIRVSAFYQGLEYTTRLVRALATGR